MIVIRQETSADYEAVYQVVKAAFASAEHSDGNEQDLVTALRHGNSFIPALSFVAECEGKIVGHILFTKAEICGTTQLALAPLSVLPEYQRQGIGSALIRRGHEVARELGYAYSVVLGSEFYYPKFGYVPASRYGIFPPFEVPDKNFMAFPLQETVPELSGVLHYAEEFGI